MIKNSIKNFIIQDKEDDDDMLHHKLFDVNIRLFNTNKKYRKLILKIVSYMKRVAKKKFKDYSAAKGISGANVGIPFNIIGVKGEDKKWDFFLNPIYIKRSKEKKVVKSNCGSLCLKEPIKVKRHVWVKVEYYDLGGTKKLNIFDGRYGYTVQHEVDHNVGILIADKRRRV
jgi:peptide deformylase